MGISEAQAQRILGKVLGNRKRLWFRFEASPGTETRRFRLDRSL